MADPENDEQLNDLLDSLLSQYSDVEPRPGLETRVLARMAESRSTSRPRRHGFDWRWTAAAAAVLMAIVAFLFYSRPARQATPPVTTVQQLPHTLPAASSSRAADTHSPRSAAMVRRPVTSRRQVATVEVKREVFPSPEPLSDQEKLLLRYLSRTPNQELLAQSHPDPVPDEDLLQNPQGVFSPLTNNGSSANSN